VNFFSVIALRDYDVIYKAGDEIYA